MYEAIKIGKHTTKCGFSTNWGSKFVVWSNSLQSFSGGCEVNVKKIKIQLHRYWKLNRKFESNCFSLWHKKGLPNVGSNGDSMTRSLIWQ